MRPREVARVRDQREEHLWSQTTVLQLTTFTENLIFYSDANQIRLLLQYGGDIKKREAAVPKCNPAFRIQTLCSSPFQQFSSTVSGGCWFERCIYIAVCCCVHTYIQTCTLGLQMSDRIEDKGMAENCVMLINHDCCWAAFCMHTNINTHTHARRSFLLKRALRKASLNRRDC